MKFSMYPEIIDLLSKQIVRAICASDSRVVVEAPAYLKPEYVKHLFLEMPEYLLNDAPFCFVEFNGIEESPEEVTDYQVNHKITFTLNVEKLRRCLSSYETEESEEPHKTYRVGQKFTVEGDTEVIALASIENNMVVAIGLHSFNRYVSPVKVSDPTNITEEEMDQIFGGDKYELVEC